MMTHSRDRESIYANTSLMFEWLEAGGDSKQITTQNPPAASPLTQGPNQEWRLFFIDDLDYDHEEDTWIRDWSKGAWDAFMFASSRLPPPQSMSARHPLAPSAIRAAAQGRLLAAFYSILLHVYFAPASFAKIALLRSNSAAERTCRRNRNRSRITPLGLI